MTYLSPVVGFITHDSAADAYFAEYVRRLFVLQYTPSRPRMCVREVVSICVQSRTEAIERRTIAVATYDCGKRVYEKVSGLWTHAFNRDSAIPPEDVHL
jgi:hypothetical protein